jgi:hypothetical protein
MVELMGALSPEMYERMVAALKEAMERAEAERAAGERRAGRREREPMERPPARPVDPADAAKGAGGAPASKEKELEQLLGGRMPPRRDPRPAGHRLVSNVLVDVINPQFKDRIDPMVSILWELLEESARETAQDDVDRGRVRRL